MNVKTRAAFELVFASMLWGFGFVAAIWALRGMGMLTITGWRFAIASAVGVGIAWLTPALRAQFSREQFLMAAIPGIFLSATIVLQTWGLQYTTATKSGLITTLYVIAVPLLEWLWLGRRPRTMHFFCVVLGLIGAIMICDAPTELAGARSRLNIGDGLTFLCMICASLHMIWFGRIQGKVRSALVFNSYQSAWACVIPLSVCWFFEPLPRLSAADRSLFGFLSLTFCSTLIAFALQVRAQKVISPSLTSLLCLLESPFATLFAFLILGETLQSTQWYGAGFILVAAALSTAFSRES